MARRIRAAAASGNVYFTSSKGVLKSTSSSSDFVLAGLPRCLDLVLSLSSAGTPVLLTDTGSSPTAGADQARGYRGVWCIRDANNNLIQGVPSSRFFIVNTAAAVRDVSVVVPIPPEITTSHFFQLYATSIVDFGATVDVGDEQRLVREYFPTSTDITNASLTIIDIVPNAFRAADLYTNELVEGQAAQNDRPPLGRDLAFFQNKLCVANLTEPHRMTLQMIGTVIAAADTITLGGVAYTGGTAETTTSGTFQVFKAGGGGFTDKGTQSLNVEYTAKSLTNVINKYAANTTIYAWYESSTDDTPGRILIEERGVGGSAFVAICSAAGVGANFSPILPTSGSTYTSVADRRVNHIRVSKDGQPEHMPRTRNIVVGGADEEIQRIIALRSCLIVIKDRSIWRLSDVEPSSAVPVFVDNTCSISGRDSAAVLNNTVIMLSDHGFVSVSENGITIIGRPTESRVLAGLEKLNAPDHATFVGIGNEQRRLYICAAWDAAANEATCYMYSPIANQGRGSWTRRRLNASAFAVHNNRLLYALNNAYGHVLRHRASRRDSVSWYRDYCEDSSTFTISSIDTTAGTCTGVWSGYVNFNAFESDIGYGWKLYDGSNQYLVLSSASANTVLTLNTTTSLTTGAKTVYRPIPWAIEWAPIAGNPLEMKCFGAVVAKVETSNAYALDFAYANQSDTKSDPVSDDWSAQPTADRVYVPVASGAEASSTSNDFAATVGVFNPYNEVHTSVHPERAMGSHLSLRISGGVAEGFVAVKALVIETEETDSTKGRQ